jgi:dCMP deaminase
MKRSLSKWEKRFMDLAHNVAQWSKDLNTKVGAVAVSKHNSVMETGFNGIARGVQDLPERLERPAKYIWTAHAEENLVTHAARRHLEGTTVYVTHLCCSTCARMLINAGVAKIVVGTGRVRNMPAEQFIAATTMLAEAGVELIEEAQSAQD